MTSSQKRESEPILVDTHYSTRRPVAERAWYAKPNGDSSNFIRLDFTDIAFDAHRQLALGIQSALVLQTAK